MKRWNGWGEEHTDYPAPASALRYLAGKVGAGPALQDAAFEQVVAAVPASRLRPHALITTDPAERVRHARGQSLPDWIAMRSGQFGLFTDGVAYPSSEAQIADLLSYAQAHGVRLIPYGGGSSVVGHITPLPGQTPVLTLDLTRMNHLVDLDETSQLATFEAGIYGPAIEAQLREKGYTLGHFPQSFELSTLGGWIAARSSGQQSYHYGRIEALFAGGDVETPSGRLHLPPVPASAAGPDLKQIVLGSEGRLGVVTRATVRIRRRPETESFHGAFFHDWPSAAAAVREMTQAHVPVSMLRASNAQETETTLALAGHENLVTWAKRGLRLAGFGEGRCLLIFGLTGDQETVSLAQRQVEEITSAHGGMVVNVIIGKQWEKTRFRTPYLRNTLWEKGYALDTLETAVPWAAVLPTAEAVTAVIRDGLQDVGERVLVFAHLSHVYTDGGSIYVTYLYRRAEDPAETLRRWQVLKTAASQVIVQHGGTISHQHGIGLDHAPYFSAEKGALGVQALTAVFKTFDPAGIMNPGKLIG
jgi:alkyldihydroxyacetonephosphate synthase